MGMGAASCWKSVQEAQDLRDMNFEWNMMLGFFEQ
jgi:hypothetical protein